MKKKITITLLISILVLGLSALVYLWYQGSCLKNHSEEFNKLGKPMIKNVLAFYKENQRYPSHKESQAIFEKMGCTNLKQKNYKESKNLKGEVYKRSATYKCEYQSKAYDFYLTIGDLSIQFENQVSAYRISFNEGNTHCMSTFHDDGTSGIKALSCSQFSCINLSH